MNIALYIRPSAGYQMSMSDQVNAMKKWAHANGHIIVEIFEEAAASTFVLERKRPVFERMVSAAMSPQKPFDLIVVNAQNRIYRRIAQRQNLERKLGQNGVQLVVLELPRQEDEMCSFLLRNITGMLDELQSRQAGARVSECMKANAESGYYNGGRPPYGYKVVATDIPARGGVKKLLAVDEKEAEVVRKIFRLACSDGEELATRMKRIAEELNANSILHRGTKWTIRHVQHVLENPVCIGNLTTSRRGPRTHLARPKEEWVTTKVAPILEQAEFETVHKLFAARRTTKTTN